MDLNEAELDLIRMFRNLEDDDRAKVRQYTSDLWLIKACKRMVIYNNVICFSEERNRK